VPPTFDTAFRREVREHLSRFTGADDRRAWRTVLATFAIFCLSLAAAGAMTRLALIALSRGAWLDAAALAGPALVMTLFLIGTSVRVFSLHHDLCHQALFSTPRKNRLAATLLGTLVSGSPSVWTREHDRHHRDSNNLDRAQDGQSASWTLQQYQAATRGQRWVYWLLNQRVVLFLLLPPLYFLVFMRVRARWYENALFFGYALGLWKLGLLWFFVACLVPGAWFGFFVFHAHHTFDGAYRRHTPQWDAFESAMLGSSILQLPQSSWLGGALRWFTLNLGVHVLHHLNPGVPGEKLSLALNARPELFAAAKRVTVGDAVRTTRYALFDEATGNFETLARHPPWRGSGSVNGSPERWDGASAACEASDCGAPPPGARGGRSAAAAPSSSGRGSE
jgi:acyl-lipid omega-6 desaturase (Delta-12 desaturase)